MKSAKPMKTPMHASNPLSSDELGKPVDRRSSELWLDHFYIYLLAYLILSIVHVCVLDFSLILESHISKLLRKSYDI